MERKNRDVLLLRKMLDSLDSRVFLWDTKTGGLLYMNGRARRAYRKAELEEKGPPPCCMTCAGEMTSCTEYCDRERQRWYRRSAVSFPWEDGALLCLEQETDITEQKETLSHLEYLKRYDKLLGLPNREKLVSDLEEILRDGGARGALLLADLDAFKDINDAFGHDYGNELLKAMGAYVTGSLDLGLAAYRTGGDEAAFVLDGLEEDTIEETVERLLSRFRRPWHVRGREEYCTLSIGVALYPENGRSVTELIGNADIAMYQAKKLGGNRAEWYAEELRGAGLERRIEMERRMRRAEERGCSAFVPFYQPIVDLETGRWVGAEALVRWRLDDGTFVQPGEFVPLAEYNGLIVPIGERILRLACMQCKEWQDALGEKRFYVSVNVSVRQLEISKPTERVVASLAESGLLPKSLVLEVTESIAIKEMQRHVEELRRLRGIGVRIALDDFGTGYSSLNNLRHLPLDIVKIDSSFVWDVQADDYHRSFIRFVHELARGAKLDICIEGIEDASQLEAVRALGGRLGQGYLFSRPIPAEEFTARLREQGRG